MFSTIESVSINVTGYKIDKSDTENLLVIKFDKTYLLMVTISSVLKQKGKSQNGFFKKTKHAKSSEKQTFLAP